MNTVTFGELIRKKRRETGVPIREIASKIELDQSILSKIERNKIQAPARIVFALSKALGLDIKVPCLSAKQVDTKYLVPLSLSQKQHSSRR